MNADDVRETLIREVGLDPDAARVFLLVTTCGRMPATDVSARLGIPAADALRACRDLVDLGGFIDMPADPGPPEFEAMHPRFTAVNMYRRMCERNNAKFARNRAVDGIGAVLEGSYDDARTK